MGATWCTCCARAATLYALDANAQGVEHVRRLAAELAPGLGAEHFRVGAVEKMPRLRTTFC